MITLQCDYCTRIKNCSSISETQGWQEGRRPCCDGKFRDGALFCPECVNILTRLYGDKIKPNQY